MPKYSQAGYEPLPDFTIVSLPNHECDCIVKLDSADVKARGKGGVRRKRQRSEIVEA
jgi:hypothetical protein